MLTDNPVTDLPIAVEIDYFRLEKNKYFVPVSVKLPGSALVFRGKGAKQATEMDFIAQIFDARNRSAAAVRDTIPLKVGPDTAGEVIQKSIEYTTGMTLSPGNYKLRFVARENGAGKVGTFETPFTIPDLNPEKTLRTSSLVLSSQREALAARVGGVKNDKKMAAANPLIADGQQLMPNVTRVFHPGQSMLAYVEVYDPAIPDSLPENFRRASIQANLALYQDGKKVFDSPAVRATRLSDSRAATLPVWLQIPLNHISPGTYICQVNLIDYFGRKFAFSRAAIAVLPQPTGSK
jgi:hypothetical protein